MIVEPSQTQCGQKSKITDLSLLYKVVTKTRRVKLNFVRKCEY